MIVEGDLYGSGVDWLTLSMGPQAVEDWIVQTEVVEAGKAQPGFASSELRNVMGGQGWRRFGPRQESTRWGMDYESWEYSGGSALYPARWARGRDVRPSRVDVAWDFTVDESVKPEHVQSAVRAHAEARGIICDGTVGENGVFTCYVGGKKSERRIRIYRKDLQSDMWLVQFGPTLRVELILKNERAEAWWQVWSDDEARAIAAAASHVFEMTGRLAQTDLAEVPQLSRAPEDLDLAQSLFAAVYQHGSTLDAAFKLGIDVPALCAERVEKASKMSKSRGLRRMGSVGRRTKEDIELWVRLLMQAKQRVGIPT